MKIYEITVYEAADGTRFDSAEECLKYEAFETVYNQLYKLLPYEYNSCDLRTLVEWMRDNKELVERLWK